MAIPFLSFGNPFFLPYCFLCGLNTIVMEATIFFSISVLMSLIVWNKFSNQYFWGRAKNEDLKKAVQPILFLHAFRFGGLSFLLTGVVHPGLDPAWAVPAAFGDFTAAVLALLTLVLINTRSFRPLLWVFNILGLLDLLLAFVDGPKYNIIPFLGATYFIVILYVPVLLLTHFLVFRLLLKSRARRLHPGSVAKNAFPLPK